MRSYYHRPQVYLTQTLFFEACLFGSSAWYHFPRCYLSTVFADYAPVVEDSPSEWDSVGNNWVQGL